MPITVERRADVAIIRLSNPPVNALSVADGTVGALAGALADALADDHCRAVVITGADSHFSGGADIADFDRDIAGLGQLRTTLEWIENADKPVVAAICGAALGGGLELALACHYRVADVDAWFGFPEITLGLLPGAGGTQRLPRLIGTKPALDMMIGGGRIDAQRALKSGLIDQVTEQDVLDSALRALAVGIEVRRSGALPTPHDVDEAVTDARSASSASPSPPAAELIIACVEAMGRSTLREGLTLEADSFNALVVSEAARALRYVFAGVRAVAKIPDLPRTTLPRAIGSVGIVGGGLMGTGIALAFLSADFPVTLVEIDDGARSRAATLVHQGIDREVAKGRLAAEDAPARHALFAVADTLSSLRSADIVIEAVYEDFDVKAAVLSALDDIVSSTAILASNTSTLDLDILAGRTIDPSRVVGLHFFSPANVMRLLEIVRGTATAPDVLATSVDLAKRLHKIGVVAGVCDGFIGNRIFEEYLRQTYFLLEEGALPFQIDQVLERWGMAMGPLRTMDLVGQDIGQAVRRRRAVDQPDRPYSGVIDRICDAGRLGQKTGRGVYAYRVGRLAERDLEVEKMIEAYSRERAIERRVISDDEILERCLLAMVNEGAKIAAEGIAYRPVDVDMVLLHGYGFPKARGGPMFQADLMGLDHVLERIRQYQSQRNGWAWEPAAILRDLAADRRTFQSLNTL